MTQAREASRDSLLLRAGGQTVDERERGQQHARHVVSQAPGLSGNSQRSSEPNRRCNALQIGGRARPRWLRKHLSERQHPRLRKQIDVGWWLASAKWRTLRSCPAILFGTTGAALLATRLEH